MLGRHSTPELSPLKVGAFCIEDWYMVADFYTAFKKTGVSVLLSLKLYELSSTLVSHALRENHFTTVDHEPDNTCKMGAIDLETQGGWSRSQWQI